MHGETFLQTTVLLSICQELALLFRAAFLLAFVASSLDQALHVCTNPVTINLTYPCCH